MAAKKDSPQYKDSNPKIDFFDKNTGKYLGSTRWHRTVRGALASTQAPPGVTMTARIDHDHPSARPRKRATRPNGAKARKAPRSAAQKRATAKLVARNKARARRR